MDYSRWMSLNKNIHGKKLANICLPTTHDSGTFDLSNVLVSDGTFVPELEKRLAELVAILNKYGILPYNKDPLAWMLEESVDSIKGLGTATKQNVATQLRMGIRGFDFSVCKDKGVYYAYRYLRSNSRLESMLDDVRTFLTDTTKSGQAVGEIVYLNLSHYLQVDDYKAFGDLVKSKLGDYAYRNLGNNDPFKATYSEIIGQSGQYKSRVILVSDTPLGDTEIFWPAGYCAPDDQRKQNVLAGMYTNSSDVDKVVQTQVSQFRSAVTAYLPFANYMTLSPGTAESINIVLSSLYGSFITLGKDLNQRGFEDLSLVAYGIAATLYGDVLATDALGWRTLEQLSHRIDKELPELVDENFIPYSGDVNQISMIFCDFWENSQLLDLCIALSNDLEMEWLGNKAIKIGFTDVSSTEGPAAAMYEGKLHMFYKGKSTDEIWSAVYDPLAKRWLANSLIIEQPGGKNVKPRTDKSPSAAVYKNVLCVAYKAARENNIRLMSWNGTSWSGGDVITVAGGISPQTDNSPYLARYKDELILVHKRAGKDDIHWSRFDGSWTGGVRIEVSDNKDQKSPGTNKRPALVEHGGLLYLLFKGSHSDNLLQCVYDGKEWTGNRDIKDKSQKFTPKSNEGPGVARFAGNIYMLYKGEASNDIWLSVFNGISWGDNVKLAKVASIDPKSDRSPCVVRVGVDLFLLNKGDSDNVYQSALTPVKF